MGLYHPDLDDQQEVTGDGIPVEVKAIVDRSCRVADEFGLGRISVCRTELESYGITLTDEYERYIMNWRWL